MDHYLTVHNKFSSQLLDENITSSGKIRFTGVRSKEAQFIRFKSDTNSFKINENIYSNKWNLKKPQLILSITGPRRNFRFKNTRMKQAFKRGLIRVTQNIDSFIITNGADSGVSKYVGEAIAEIRNNAIHKPNLIGILIWNTVAGRDILTRNTEKFVLYGLKENLNLNKTANDVCLDSNHSHFILADDPHATNFKSELNIRSRIESELRKRLVSFNDLDDRLKSKKRRSIDMKNASQYHSNDELNKSIKENENENKSLIPLISILINGGIDSLLVVKENLTKKVPTLLLSGSKGATDLICKIITSQDALDDKALEKIIKESKILERKKYSQTNDVAIKTCKDRIREIEKFKSNDLLHIFELDDEDESSSSDGLELAILRAFLYSQKNQHFENLKLALQWDRIDIAKTDIITYEFFLQPSQLAKLLELALVENKPDFVELILQNGANLDAFLTYGRLYYLYNSKFILDDFKRAPLFEIYKLRYNCEKEKIFITFKKIKNILKQYTAEDMGFEFIPSDISCCLTQDESIEWHIRNFLDDKFNHEIDGELIIENTSMNDAFLKERVKEPGQNLFIWALLLERIEIAKIFWQFGQYQMGNALLSSILLKNLSNLPQSRHLMSYSNEFIDLAIGVLKLFDLALEDHINFKYLSYKIEFYGFDCLQIAFTGNISKFMSQLCVQTYLDSVWLGEVTSKTGILASIKVFISCLSFGFLAPFLLYEKSKLRSRENSNELTRSKVDTKREKSLDEIELLKFKRKNNKIHKISRASTPENDTLVKSNKTYWELYIDFMHSPRTHFANIIGMYLIFLFLFSYLMLSEFRFYEKEELIVTVNKTLFNNLTNLSVNYSTQREPIKRIAKPHWLEYVLLFWIFTLLLEEIRQFMSSSDNENVFKKKLIKYLRNNWNYFDITGCLLFFIGISFRFISLRMGYNLFVFARIILCIDLIIWYLRLLHVSIVFKALGPKLVMIQKMFHDLILFMIMIMIFVCCFGVVTHSALYPASNFDVNLLRSLFTKAYWPVYGTIKMLEDFDRFYNTDCKVDCPEESGVIFSFVVLMIYMVIANVLLLNLLIAMFSSTYNRVQENTDSIWKFQRYKLVYEYKDSPILPPPFSILVYIWYLINLLIKKIFRKTSVPNEESKIEEAEEIEKKLAEEYLEHIRKTKRESTEARLKSNAEKLEMLETKINAIIEFQTRYFKKFS